MTTVKHPLSAGILHPLQVNRFRAVFKTPEGEALPYGDPLTAQLVRTSEFGLYKGIAVVIEEDITGHAGRAVQQLTKLSNFTLDIEYLDGNNTVIKTASFIGCKVSNTLYSGLDYAGGKSSVGEVLRLSVPRWEGKKFDELAAEHPTAATLIAFLKGAQLEVIADRDGKRGIAEVTLTINYGDLAVTWADLG
jgi:hypothetical protein